VRPGLAAEEVVRAVPHRVEPSQDDPFAERPGADREFGDPELVHRGVADHRPGEQLASPSGRDGG
jgi:hypothetical protein